MAFSNTAVVDPPVNGVPTTANQAMFSKTIGSAYDVFYANHIPNVYKRYGQQFYDTLAFVQALGRIEPVDSDSVTLHEENRYHTTIKINNGAGYNVLKTATTVTIYSNEYVRVGDIVALSTDGSKLGRVMVVNSATSIDLATVDGGTTAIVNNQVLPIVSGMFLNGTGQPLPAVSGYSKTTFTPQIVKETIGTDGRSLVMGTWFGDTFWSEQLLQGEYRQSLKIGGAMLLGQNPAGDGALASYIGNGTKGLIPTIRSRGAIQTYTAGSYSLQDLYDMELYMLQQGVSSNVILGMVGSKLNQELTDAAADLLKGSATGALGNDAFVKTIFPNYVNDGSAGSNAEAMALNFNFKMFQIYNTTYIIKMESQFMNPVTLGASGMEFPNNGIFLPVASVMDAKTKTKMSNLAIRPMAKNGYNRFMETWQQGAAGGNSASYVGDTDEKKMYWRSDFIVQIVGANQMCYVETA